MDDGTLDGSQLTGGQPYNLCRKFSHDDDRNGTRQAALLGGLAAGCDLTSKGSARMELVRLGCFVALMMAMTMVNGNDSANDR